MNECFAYAENEVRQAIHLRPRWGNALVASCGTGGFDTAAVKSYTLLRRHPSVQGSAGYHKVILIVSSTLGIIAAEFWRGQRHQTRLGETGPSAEKGTQLVSGKAG